MQNYLDDFLKHLKYERNASPHTLRNYEIDLVQFYDHLAPPDKATMRQSRRDRHDRRRHEARTLAIAMMRPSGSCSIAVSPTGNRCVIDVLC